MGDFYEKYLRLGLVLGWLAILKKEICADYEQFLRAVISCFQGQKKVYFFFKILYYIVLAKNKGMKRCKLFLKTITMEFFKD